jgi:hypothetical protein
MLDIPTVINANGTMIYHYDAFAQYIVAELEDFFDILQPNAEIQSYGKWFIDQEMKDEALYLPKTLTDHFDTFQGDSYLKI